MKHKTTYCLLLLSAFLLSACGASTLEKPYQLKDFEAGNVFQTENSGLQAEGFAKELCIADEDVSRKNAEGVNAGSFALFDPENGEIIAYENLFERVYPASTTKVLTCLIALEEGNLDDIVTVPSESAITVSGSSMADLKPGDSLSLRDLLYGLMVPSGNDAAVAIAHYIAGSEAAFAEMMNERALKLGATQSHFVNAHGLPDEEHYTTAYDMYLILNEALKHPEFIEFGGTKEYMALVKGADGSTREVSWENGNAFLSGKFSMPDGMSVVAGKTGHTNAAGFCLVLSEADTAGKQYISVVFKAPSYEELYQSMQNLIEKHGVSEAEEEGSGV